VQAKASCPTASVDTRRATAGDVSTTAAGDFDRRAEDAERQGFLRREWDVGTKVQAIDGEHDLFGDGRLTLIPLPGHTPGSMGARAVLDRSGSFLLASDAVPVAASLARRMAPRNTWNPALFLSSLDEIARHRDDGAMVLFGNDDAQWRAVRTGASYYD
jgi:glyoxylase-like metal-dependent hydrolase (beta-lactamase superfamily II)